MIDIIQKPKMKIYRDNKLDITLTYKPVVRELAQKFAETIDRWFVEHKW